MKIKYSLEHNWVELKRKVVTIGITDYLLDELGDLIDLCLPRVGEEIISGISYGEIESVNILRDLIAPLSGEIVKVNSDLVTNLRTLQRDPSGNGWFIKVRVADVEQLDILMDEDEYEGFRKSVGRGGKEAGKKKRKADVRKNVAGKNTGKEKKKTAKKSKKR